MSLQGMEKQTPSLNSLMKEYKEVLMIVTGTLGALVLLLFGGEAVAIDLPAGENKAESLTMAATTLKTVDSVLFSWIAPLIAGVFVIMAGIWLKDQRYSLAAMAFVAAIMLGTAGSWVTDIFGIGGEEQGGVFSTGSYEYEVITDVRVV